MLTGLLLLQLMAPLVAVITNDDELVEKFLAVSTHMILPGTRSQSDATQRPSWVAHLTDTLQDPGPETLDRTSRIGVSAFSVWVKVKKYSKLIS